MNLKNYTSEVPASRSIERIKNVLRNLKVRNINEEYDDNGRLIGVKFLLDVKGQTVAFELPAKIDTIADIMYRQLKKPIPSSKQRCQEQAERTAWKTVQDWIEVQATMIALEQADVLEVFLPYALVSGTSKTFYNHIKEGNLKLLTQ